MMQRIHVVWCGIPPRGELDAMRAAPWLTDVPQHWVRKLLEARDHLDRTEQLPDGCDELIAHIDAAHDIEDQAVVAFNL